MNRRELLTSAGTVTVATTLAHALPDHAFAHMAQVDVEQLPTGVEGWTQRPWMKADYRNSLTRKYLSKPVKRSLAIDDMSTDRGWKISGVGKVEYTSRKARTGTHSMAVTVPTRNEEYIHTHRKDNGSFWSDQGTGTSLAVLDLPEKQDWTSFNRLSVWIYTEGQQEYPHWIQINFRNDSPSDRIGAYEDLAMHEAEVFPNQWTHIVWEFPSISREMVGQISIGTRLIGRFGEEDPHTTYYIDRIDIQDVDVEQYEGWNVTEGKIAFNHVGYLPHDVKRAIIGEGVASEFEVLSLDTDVVFSGQIQPVTSPKGNFGLLDFSALTTPGRYAIRAGGITTRPFSIGEDVWLETLEKNVNALHGRRCGIEIPGVHPACHFDIVARYDGRQLIGNGGWHDAADTHQNSNTTSQIVGGMMAAYRGLPDLPKTRKLRKHLVEEIVWGVDWLLRTRFGNGVRFPRVLDRFYGDNIVGTEDDMVTDVEFDPWFAAVSAYYLAEAADFLADLDPSRAKACRDAAIEDYAATFESGVDWEPIDPSINASFDTASVDGAWAPREAPNIAYAALAACAIHKLTGRASDKDRAIRFGDQLLECQERSFRGSPITGFFYESLDRDVPMHEVLMSTQESLQLALVRLCQDFPDHERWMEWYGAAAIHADYFLGRGATASAPYDHIPSAVWTQQNMDSLVEIFIERTKPNAGFLVKGPAPSAEDWPGMIRTEYHNQLTSGTQIAGAQWLRTLPIYTTNTFKTYFIGGGDTHPMLSSTGGLAAVAAMRGNRVNEDLVKRQIGWILGANPFSQSIMYGEGYDFQDLWTCWAKTPVGALPVGPGSINGDTPHWTPAGHPTVKESWGISQGKFFFAASNVLAPAKVSGAAPVGAIFTDINGKRTPVPPGPYEIELPAGPYEVSFGNSARSIELVGGTNIELQLDPDHHIAATLSAETATDGHVVVRAKASGRGTAELELRLFNAAGDDLTRRIDLSGGGDQTLQFQIAMRDPDQPYGAILFDKRSNRAIAELFGTSSRIPMQLPSN